MAIALLYNLSEGEKLQKLRFHLLKLGVRARTVAPEEFGRPIGSLCSLEGFSPEVNAEEGSFSEEMLVLCGLSGSQLDALLDALRASRVSLSLKAVVTEENAQWSSLRLHEELVREHEAMRALHPVRKHRRK